MADSPSPRPPSWLEKFLLWGLDPEVAEDILGDLHELYLEHANAGLFKARWKYFLGTISLIRLFRINLFRSSNPFITLAMLKHYFTIAIRNLRKHAGYSFINIFGLGVGLAACLLIMMFVRHEVSYDTFHEHKDRIFRVSMEMKDADNYAHIAISPTAVWPVFQREFPEVETGVRLYPTGGFSPSVIRYKDKVFQEGRFFFSDSTLFDVFSFELLKGNPKTALNRPSTIVITASMASKYFGEEDAMGKILNVDNNRDYEVTGIIADMPANSHFHADFLASFASLRVAKQEIWWSANYQTYLLLHSTESVHSLRDKIPPLIKREVGSDLGEGRSLNYILTPLEDIHLYSSAEGELEPGSDIRYVYLFSGIALLILLIACINYMNLATARSVERAREVGLRKVVGAQKRQLFTQFMGEASLITLLALMIAVTISQMALPWFNELVRRDLTIDFFSEPVWLAALIGLGFLVSLLAGAYPAIAFTNFQPIKILRGQYRNSSGGSLLRKGLVVFQFAISVFLIVATIVVYRQLSLIQNTNLGYHKDQLVSLPMDRNMIEKWESISKAFTASPLIKNVTAVSENPTSVEGTYSLFKPSNEENSKLVQAMAADIEIVETLGLEILTGTNYTPASAMREDYPFLLNESAARAMGYDITSAVGKPLNLNGREGFVQAVIKDFHIASLHKPISPLVIFLSKNDYNEALVKMSAADITGSIDHLRATWEEMIPHRPFEMVFLDDAYDKLYQAEQQIGSAFGIFAFLAIIIASLGLFGLAAYTTVQRAKEIGIRKVLGASVMNVVSLLTREFTQLVGISILISLPLAWWVMSRWLEGFAYRVSVGSSTLIIAGLTALLIAWLTVSYQSFRAAIANPVDTLKDE